MSTYRAIDVWERKNAHTVVRYRCFESLDTGRYCILPTSAITAKLSENLENQFVELFTEQDRAQRSGEYDTLKAAIAAHKREFGEAAG